jgi:Tfp pilus assembly protein PilF
MSWIVYWLDKRGLGSVADTLDRRAVGVGDIEAMHDLARRAMNRGEAEVAIEQLKKAIALKPDDAALCCSLGAAYRHAGRFDEARETFLRALTLNADYPQVLSNLGEWLCFRRFCSASGRFFVARHFAAARCQSIFLFIVFPW